MQRLPIALFTWIQCIGLNVRNSRFAVWNSVEFFFSKYFWCTAGWIHVCWTSRYGGWLYVAGQFLFFFLSVYGCLFNFDFLRFSWHGWFSVCSVDPHPVETFKHCFHDHTEKHAFHGAYPGTFLKDHVYVCEKSFISVSWMLLIFLYVFLQKMWCLFLYLYTNLIVKLWRNINFTEIFIYIYRDRVLYFHLVNFMTWKELGNCSQNRNFPKDTLPSL